MDLLTISFVGLLFAAGILLTLGVRSQILRAVDAKREEQHTREEEIRRQHAQQGNPRSATRR
jgi:hypothetical protein